MLELWTSASYNTIRERERWIGDGENGCEYEER